MKSVLGSGILLAAFILAGAGCAHHPDVRASADGIHRVVITSDDQEEGQREAIRQARHKSGANSGRIDLCLGRQKGIRSGGNPRSWRSCRGKRSRQSLQHRNEVQVHVDSPNNAPHIKKKTASLRAS